jgi:hypothetical protein
MSVDKFGRHESTVQVRRETRRSLREDLGFGLTADADFDVQNKKIRNLGDPVVSSDAVSLRYVQDHCLLLPEQSGGGGVDVKGAKLVNVDTPVDLKDAANRYYVDNNCLQFVTGRNDTKRSVIDALDHRIISLRAPLQSRDAANKRYVDAMCLPKDQHGNVDVGERRLTRVQAPLMNTDAVNLEFLHAHTLSLQGSVFNGSGRRITNVADGVDNVDAVNARQMHDLTRYTKSELYKVVKILRTRIDKVLAYVYKIHGTAARGSLDADEFDRQVEDNAEVSALIDGIDATTDINDWRSVYKNGANRTEMRTNSLR